MVIYASYEDYLYILVGVVWVIFSYYNAQRKKKAKGEKKSPQKQSPSFLETLMDEFGGKEEEKSPVYSDPYYENDDLVVKTEGYSDGINENHNYSDEVFSYNDYDKKSNYQAPTAVNVKKVLRKVDNVTSTDTVIKSTKNKVKKIDLKKAIIYSEILKKQYF